jgi:hypothetical protein
MPRDLKPRSGSNTRMPNRLNRSDRYRKEAIRLMALAKFATSPRVRARYLNIAKRYEALAMAEVSLMKGHGRSDRSAAK